MTYSTMTSNPFTCRDEATLSLSKRLIFGVLGGGVLALLVTAWMLRPDPSGMGTHQQLGLPACTIAVLFDKPCPSCGMTTSWSYLTQGKVLSALKANAGGAMLGVIAACFAPWALIASIRGRFPWGVPSDEWLLGGTLFLIGVILVNWGVRLYWTW